MITGAEAFREYISLRVTLEHFAHGRSIRNALDRSRLRQANRLFAQRRDTLKKADLMTIEPEDIRASRVFVEGRLDNKPGEAPE